MKGRKYVFFITIIVVIGITLTLVLIPRLETSDCPAPLSQWKKMQIEKDFEKYFLQSCPYWFGGEYPPGEISYLGSSNGYAIILYNPRNQIDVPYTYSIKIGNEVEFKYLNSSARFYAYKNGEFFNLADTYEKGLINRDELEKAAKLHSEAFEKVYNSRSE